MIRRSELSLRRSRFAWSLWLLPAALLAVASCAGSASPDDVGDAGGAGLTPGPTYAGRRGTIGDEEGEAGRPNRDDRDPFDPFPTGDGGRAGRGGFGGFAGRGGSPPRPPPAIGGGGQGGGGRGGGGQGGATSIPVPQTWEDAGGGYGCCYSDTVYYYGNPDGVSVTSVTCTNGTKCSWDADFEVYQCRTQVLTSSEHPRACGL